MVKFNEFFTKVSCTSAGIASIVKLNISVPFIKRWSDEIGLPLSSNSKSFILSVSLSNSYQLKNLEDAFLLKPAPTITDNLSCSRSFFKSDITFLLFSDMV